MAVEQSRGEETRESNTVADFLHQETGRSQSRGREVLTRVVVDDDADGAAVRPVCMWKERVLIQVGRRHDRVTDDQSLGKLLGSCHLGDGAKVHWVATDTDCG